MFPRPTILIAAAAAGALIVAGCESSSRSVTGPSGSKCAISIPTTLPPVGASGGSGSLVVTAARECAWTASSAAEWIVLENGAGHGSGAVTYSVRANPIPAARQGALLVGDSTATLVQGAATCAISVEPSSIDIGATGGTARVTIGTMAACRWTADVGVDWIEIVDDSSGTGPGRITLRIAPNGGAERTGVLTVSGRALVVRQDGVGAATCRTTVTTNDLSAPSAGTSATIGVTAGAGCEWTATSHDTWIAVTGGARGHGSGVVHLTIDANPGSSARTGRVTVGSQTIVVVQPGGGGGGSPSCESTVSPLAHTVGAAGGTAAVSVTVAGGCGWTSVSHASWIAIAAGASGQGTGDVTLSIEANTGPERAGIVTIANQSVTVSQAAAASQGPGPDPTCTYSVEPTTQAVPLIPLGEYALEVETQPGCAWTADTDEGWITITKGRNGTGNGVVVYTVSVSLFTRTGTIDVAGQSVTVAQGGLLRNSQ